MRLPGFKPIRAMQAPCQLLNRPQIEIRVRPISKALNKISKVDRFKKEKDEAN